MKLTLSFQSSRFFYMPKKSSQKFKYLENEESFFIIFERLPLTEIKTFFERRDSGFNWYSLINLRAMELQLISNGTITLLYHFYVSLRLCPNLSLADLGTQTRERGKIKSNPASWSVSFSDSNVCIVPFLLLYLDCST